MAAERLDISSGATVRAMIAYVADDAKIARHVGCSIGAVAAIRRQAPKPCRMAMRGPPPGTETEVLHLSADPWTRSCREGSRQLLEALRRVYGPPGRPA
jgi:hypothetical protein